MARLRLGAGELGHGRWSRLFISLQVVLTGVLALAAVLMINWLAGRPGLRQRFDLTATEQNTLSTATLGVLERLPGEVTIDVFFRAEPGPLEQPAAAAMERTSRVLGLFRDLSFGNVRIRHNDMGDTVAIEERKRALKLRGLENCLVVSYGSQAGALDREVVPVIGGLAEFEAGTPPPDYRPARIIEFRAEEAVSQALLKVTRGQVLDVYFTSGHGEFEVFNDDQFGLDELAGLLGEEGLRVNTWNPNQGEPFPDSCACLSILNPRDALSDAVLDQVEAYVRAGGRLVVAPAAEDPDLERSRLNELVGRFDLEIQAGIVCQPQVDPQSGSIGYQHPKNTILTINPARMRRHSLVDPFRLEGRTFYMAYAHPVRFTGQPQRGASVPLFTSEVQVLPGHPSWVDAWDDRSQNYNYVPDDGEAMSRAFELAIASQFRPSDEVVKGLEQEVESRVLLVGGAYPFTNALFENNYDFLRNAYNWVLDREYRLSISAKPPDVRMWPQAKLDELPRINQLAWGWLPGLCLVLGFLTAFLRSRGGPRAASSPTEAP